MFPDMFSLEGKCGIVTGSVSGIGKAVARGLAEAGGKVVIADVRFDELKETADEITSEGHSVIPVAVDMRSMDSIRNLVDTTVNTFGRIDFLFNNAGVLHREPCEELKKEAWDEVMQVNLSGPFFLAQTVAKVMIEKETKGKIVNTSSLMAVLGGRSIPAYTATKGALAQVTKAMCNDWGKYGIRVNAIGPGYVKTEMTDSLQKDKERFTEIESRIPLGRWAEPEDFAGPAVFLASDASDYITGQVIFIDGGYLAM